MVQPLLTDRVFQPESSCQFLAVSELIWKGLGSWAVLSVRRISAFTSCASVSSSVPLGSTRQLAMAPMPRRAVSRPEYSVEKVPTVTLLQSLFELVGQLGVEAAADVELAAFGEHGRAAGGGDAFGGGFRRPQKQQRAAE